MIGYLRPGIVGRREDQFGQPKRVFTRGCRNLDFEDKLLYSQRQDEWKLERWYLTEEVGGILL